MLWCLLLFIAFYAFTNANSKNEPFILEFNLSEIVVAPTNATTFGFSNEWQAIPVNPKRASLPLKATSPSSSQSQSHQHLPFIPDMSDKQTALSFAKMSANAYISPSNGNDWYDLEGHYRLALPFGWDSNGLRGHVFKTPDNSTIVLAIKGTSASFFGFGETETSKRDKFTDNSMFSCCCGKVDFTWTPVCGCAISKNTCDTACLSEHLQDPTSYFEEARSLTRKIRSLYPHAKIWYTGHSLGGALASLLAVNEETVAVTFGSPGELHFAQRYASSLSSPSISGNTGFFSKGHPSTYPIFHFGHSMDVIFQGVCNGVTSSCYIAGYAMETKCHIGSRCEFVRRGRPNIVDHRISYYLNNIFNQQQPEFDVLDDGDLVENENEDEDEFDVLNDADFDEDEFLSDRMPECKPEIDCKDCQTWRYVREDPASQLWGE